MSLILSLAQFRLQRLHVGVKRRVGLAEYLFCVVGFGPWPDVVAAGLEDDDPKPLPLRGPALYVLTAQVGLYDFSRARVLTHEPLLRKCVDQERLVQAGLYAVERLDPCELGEGDAVCPDLLHQVVHGARFKAPGVLPEALFRDGVGVLLDVGSDVGVQRFARELNDVYAALRFGLFPARLPEEDDAGEYVGVLEDRGVTEVYDLLDHALGRKVSSQWLAVAGPQPLVGDDVAHPPATPQSPQALFVEVHVEVGDAVVNLGVGVGKVGLAVPERFLADVGRVADDGIEAGVVAEGAALPVEEDLASRARRAAKNRRARTRRR